MFFYLITIQIAAALISFTCDNHVAQAFSSTAPSTSIIVLGNKRLSNKNKNQSFQQLKYNGNFKLQFGSTSLTPYSTSLCMSPSYDDTDRDDEKIENESSATERKSIPAVSGSPVNLEAVIYMSLLAIQFGIQPSLVRKFAPSGSGMIKSSFVLVQESLKLVLSLIGLFILSPKNVSEKAVQGWTLPKAFKIAGIPALLYCIQNIASLQAYQNLQPLTYNVLNQTKTLSAALCCYLVMGRKQSRIQILSLLLLLGSALVIEQIIDPLSLLTSVFSTSGISTISIPSFSLPSLSGHHIKYGVLPILLASFLSGLAGALSQKNLQSSSGCGKSGGRNSLLFSAELNFFSSLILLISLLFSMDGKSMRTQGFFNGWTKLTILPIVVNAFGGILVGLVTKYAGSVRKGFALIFGIVISGIVQQLGNQANALGVHQIVGGILAGVSLLMHTSYPYIEKKEDE